LKGIEETAVWTKERVEAIRNLFENTVRICREKAPKVYSKELVEAIFAQPYCKISFLTESGIAKRQSASLYLKELERLGILQSEKRGRESIYKHLALLDILTR
jgi:Fic family protein